ncbi:unnamed protein product [Closterium sp. NIES-64]|nr:unnamed protein product [Closterium sp. Naga37s-1]CAI6000336.1 unnamed protein product [Closterium sp. NIES-64]
MVLPRQLYFLGITLALLLAPAAAARPSKEDLIAEVKNVRVALDDPELSSQYRASAMFLDTLIPQLETNWNPTDDFLASTEGKTVLLPDDNAIASAAPGALADLMNPSLPRQKVRSYASMIRANLLNGVYDEDGIKKAKVLTDGNGRKVFKAFQLDRLTKKWKPFIGKKKAKIKRSKLFRGKLFVIHGVDKMQKP